MSMKPNTSPTRLEITTFTDSLTATAEEIAKTVDKILSTMTTEEMEQELNAYLHIFCESPLNELIHFKSCLTDEFLPI